MCSRVLTAVQYKCWLISDQSVKCWIGTHYLDTSAFTVYCILRHCWYLTIILVNVTIHGRIQNQSLSAWHHWPLNVNPIALYIVNHSDLLSIHFVQVPFVEPLLPGNLGLRVWILYLVASKLWVSLGVWWLVIWSANFAFTGTSTSFEVVTMLPVIWFMLLGARPQAWKPHIRTCL